MVCICSNLAYRVPQWKYTDFPDWSKGMCRFYLFTYLLAYLFGQLDTH